jgi:cell division protein FtsB
VKNVVLNPKEKFERLQEQLDKQTKEFQKLDKEMKRLRKFVHNVKHGNSTEALATLANDEIIDEL